MRHGEHYRVTLTQPVDESIDTETLISRVDYLNCRDRYLLFEGPRERQDGTVHRLEFLYVSNVDRSKQSITQEMEELSKVFEQEIRLEPLAPHQMSPGQLRRLRTAKQLMYGTRFFRGEEKVRWRSRSEQQVRQEVAAMTGFSAFKSFFEDLCTYIENAEKFGSEANCNVVLINGSGMDDERFMNYLFDLYSSKGIILDHRILTADLEDAVKAAHDTPCMYWIDEIWDSGQQGSRYAASFDTSSFRTLARRKAIHLTSMNRVQYSKFRHCAGFCTLFAHSVEISDLSSEEKLALLAEEVRRQGFDLDPASFVGIELLTLPFATIQDRIAEVVNAHLKQRDIGRPRLVPADFSPVSSQADEEDPWDELESLVGLNAVKKKVREIVGLVEQRGVGSLPCLHMVFKGNPGTGKTTVARILARIFAQSGIIPRGDRFVETGREGLVGQYVGHTAVRTSEKINEAMGGVLFIDEAYSLGLYDGRVDYGAEALSVLVKRMEDYRHDFVCIMAGYPEEMDKMLDINPGLRERVQFYVDFPDYEWQELLTMFQKMCIDSSYKLSEEARMALASSLQQMVAAKGRRFGNGRLVRKLFERARMKQALRGDDDHIQGEDIAAVLAEPDIASIMNGGNNTREIGFGR